MELMKLKYYKLMFDKKTKKNFYPRGFTLLEILIAIFILGVVLATAYASYSGILRVSRDVEHEAKVYKMARTTMDKMIRDLTSIQPSGGSFELRTANDKLSRHEFKSVFFWSAAHLAFNENEVSGSPTSIAYFVQEDEDGSFSLRRSDDPGVKSSKGKNVGGGFVICQNVDSLNLIFYDSKGKEYDSWDTSSFAVEQKGKAPTEVKIELGLVNLNDKEKPYKFMTKVFIPVKE